jgi:hypothetical protein
VRADFLLRDHETTCADQDAGTGVEPRRRVSCVSDTLGGVGLNRRAAECSHLARTRTWRDVCYLVKQQRTARGLVFEWKAIKGQRAIAPTAFDFAIRLGSSTADLKVTATTGPTPGTVISRRQTESSPQREHGRAKVSGNLRRVDSKAI